MRQIQRCFVILVAQAFVSTYGHRRTISNDVEPSSAQTVRQEKLNNIGMVLPAGHVQWRVTHVVLSIEGERRYRVMSKLPYLLIHNGH